MKTCAACGKDKDESEFYRVNGKPHGYCKLCSRAEARRWTSHNPKKKAEHQRRYRDRQKINQDFEWENYDEIKDNELDG